MNFLKFFVILFLGFLPPLLMPQLSQAEDMQARQVQYFTMMQDIPVMPGLTPVEEESYVFDKPEGRILSQSALTTSRDEKEVFAYYAKALPPLGWTRKTTRIFVRDKERLKITAQKSEENKNALKIHFFLEPQK